MSNSGMGPRKYPVVRNLAAGCLAIVLASCSSRTIESVRLTDRTGNIYGQSYSLPRSLVTFAVKMEGPKLTIEKAPTLEYVPDPNARFQVALNTSAFSSDDLKVTTEANGLLKGVNSTVEDQSIAITDKVIELVTTVAKIGAEGIQTLDAEKAPPSSDNFYAAAAIDPFRPTESVREFKKVSGIDVSFTDIFGQSIKYDPIVEREASAGCNESLCFRLVTPVIMTLSKGDTFVAKYVTTVPNPQQVAGFDVRRAACVNKETILAFSNGILTEAQIKKPSEVLGCLSIPIALAKAIASFPGQLIQVRVDNYNQSASLNEAERKAINAQIELLKTQAALLAAQQQAAAKP